MAADLSDAVYGCIMGGAIGDALGAPVEGWHWTDIRERHGKVDRFLDFDAGYARGAGHVTDDSYLRHLLCIAIVQRGGRVTPDEFARVLEERVNLDRLWVNESLVLTKIRQGMNPWWETGRGNIPAGCASMCIAPIGIINAADPRQAYQDAFCVASIDQDGNNRDFAATFAAGVAAAFGAGATIDTVIDAMLEHSDYVTRRALQMALRMAADAANVDEFAASFYTSPLLDWTWPQRRWQPDRHFCGNSIEFLPAVAAILRLCDGDPASSIVEGASFGRDCDTIASCCGCVVGALHGASALDPALVAECEHANADIFQELHGERTCGFRQMADRLVEALKGERSRAAARLRALEQVLH